MNKKTGFIGAGNMATAIINGMLKAGTSPDSLVVFDVDKEKCAVMADKGIKIADSGAQLMQECYYTVLAVKPQQLPTVLDELKAVCDESKVVVSIAAGISTDYLQKNLGVTCPCVRVMPNTPLLLGCGATALSKTDNVSDIDFAEVKSMFDNSGITAVISEDKMNAIISVNGSSPAYFYLFAKAMQEYAVEQGIDADTAMQLICATMKGSAEMLVKSGDDAQTLIKKVSSPGGTTLKALDVFYENKTEQTIKDAMAACTKRALELAGE
ncbi:MULTISPECIES: pyrroline-5-carboxylate reductase [unclassified Ruminococcus]|uniref:pyrroline-5-carboxylate reductase n=1 Tax=unclassified Ruminococcus TaxID=2608920 RepID=UPI00210AE143|nr:MULTISPECIES: pyrroline-5-carboxylate reductase [unclassified Ruminococcus]MCQ4022531.1 pyrroline-5-carboxylate reductase [Ruminococcus sp. zg-924]MCQ4115125.1 pyrroline-5-carboxylate reductase [Ruminococcus sp. zg-921]